MNKKLMLLVVGALTALAFTALPGAASAKETKLNCENQFFSCTFTIAGGVSRFSLNGGDTVKCTGLSGSGAVTGLDANRESTTSEVQLLFTGCKEQNTIFQFACTNTMTAGNVTTNLMTGHSVALPETWTEAGVLLTNAGVTFTCAGGFASTQLTGNVIGESETKCNTNTGTIQTLDFSAISHGTQTDRTYTALTNYELSGKTNHSSGGSYATAALTGTATLTFNQNVQLTCA
jgi:hypothetical protein